MDRRESRGAHFRADFPQAVEPAAHTLIALPGRQALKVAAE
jgi:aspartate oxidase